MPVTNMLVTHFVEQDGMMVPADKLRVKETPDLVKFNGMIMSASEYERKKGMSTGAEISLKHVDSLEGKALDKGNEHQDNFEKELKESVESIENIKQDLLKKREATPKEVATPVMQSTPNMIAEVKEVSGEEMDALKALRVKFKEVTGKAVAPAYTKNVEYMQKAIDDAKESTSEPVVEAVSSPN